MKPGRNDPCPCGSGKKYKRCCMDAVAKPHAELSDEIAQILAMSPDLSMDDLNLVLQQRVSDLNNRPNPDFCGLSPTQLENWLYAPFSALDGVTISIPDDLSASPVMRYLQLIFKEAMAQDGSFKATAKGNLPAKLVKRASELLPEFAVAKYESEPSVSEFAGSNEDSFNALHYTRILADLAGILYFRSGRIHIKQSAQKLYQRQGLGAFFLPMLEAAVEQYNWAYMDRYSDAVRLQTFWLFMLWRLQQHGDVGQLEAEVCTAFPDLLHELPQDKYASPQGQLQSIIESRFLCRFLQFWGFVIVDPRIYVDGRRVPAKAEIQPLMTQTFSFSV